MLLLAGMLAVAAFYGCGDEDDASDDDVGDDDAGHDDDDSLYVDESDPFGPGALTVQRLDLTQGESGAPVDLSIYHPVDTGQYALIQFQHGFLMSKNYYSGILERLAGHGFAVVAPQMYEPGGLPIGKPTSVEEAQLSGEVAVWALANLGALTGLDVRGDLLGLVGHSRGGKATWILLKGNQALAKAVAGLDPVDSEMPLLGETRVCDGPFGFPFPSLLIGTGLGPVPVLGQACAPEGGNHEQFHQYSASPAYHVIAADYGHLDMLDDETPGCGLAGEICEEGPERAGMRTLSAGLLVAFFRATLQGDERSYEYLTDPARIPGNVEIEWK